MSAVRSAAADRPSRTIHPDTAIGTVRLTVSDLAFSRSFYERAIGLSAAETEDGAIAVGVAGESPLIELHGDSSASALDRHTTGLYHLAILVPNRAELGHALGRLAAAGWPLDGASDHLVSEALYLSDPDGNGIEIYRDRPRAEWHYDGGTLAMATLPLDLQSVVDEIGHAPAPQPRAPRGTRIGHVHLQVSELDQAEEFYSGVLGFDVVVRGYPGALFVSAGGYHHHLGLNTWHSLGAGPPPPGAVGLREFEIVLPSEDELGRVLARVSAKGIVTESRADGSLVRDPAGNGMLLRAA